MQRLFTIIIAPLLLVLAVSLLAVGQASKDNAGEDNPGAGDPGKERGSIEVRSSAQHPRDSRTAPSKPHANKAAAKPRGETGDAMRSDSVESLANKFARLMADERAAKTATASSNSPAHSATSRSDENATETRQALLDQLAAGARGATNKDGTPQLRSSAEPSGGPSSVSPDRRAKQTGRGAPAFLPRSASTEKASQNVTLSGHMQIAKTPEDLTVLDSRQPIGYLTITGDQFTNRSLKYLEDKQILSLSIEAVNISNPGLLHLTKVKGLRALRLWAPGVDDGGLAIIAQLPDLEQLDVDGAHIQGTGLAQASGFQKLFKLTLGPWIHDREIELLGDMPQLTQLDLRSCQRLTDACAEPIGQLRNLRMLWLPTQLSDATRKSIRKSLPHCQVRS